MPRHQKIKQSIENIVWTGKGEEEKEEDKERHLFISYELRRYVD